MASPIKAKVKNLQALQDLIHDHGADEGVTVYLCKRIDSLSQGKTMGLLLLEKEKDKRWKLRPKGVVQKMIQINDSLEAADSIIDDLIRRTNPTTFFPRRPGYSVAPNIRVAVLLQSASRRPSNGRAFPAAISDRNSASSRRTNSDSSALPGSLPRRSSARRHPVPYHLALKLCDAGEELEMPYLYELMELWEIP